MKDKQTMIRGLSATETMFIMVHCGVKGKISAENNTVTFYINRRPISKFWVF